MKLDVSIHFQTDSQSVEEVRRKLYSHIDKTELPFDFGERERTILHHCFLPEKELQNRNIDTNIYEEIFKEFAEFHICWYGLSPYGLVWDRQLMLENLKKVNGIALFIGEITGGVEKELKLCKELDIEFILIP